MAAGNGKQPICPGSPEVSRCDRCGAPAPIPALQINTSAVILKWVYSPWVMRVSFDCTATVKPVFSFIMRAHGRCRRFLRQQAAAREFPQPAEHFLFRTAGNEHLAVFTHHTDGQEMMRHRGFLVLFGKTPTRSFLKAPHHPASGQTRQSGPDGLHTRAPQLHDRLVEGARIFRIKEQIGA